MSTRTTRRGWMRGVGTTALALPFLRSFAAHGQPAGPQPKLLFFATPNAFLVDRAGDPELGYEGWLPDGFPGGDGAASQALPARLPPIFQPLDSLKAKLWPVDGLKGGDTGAHQQAAAMLTGGGVFANERARAGGGDGEWYSTHASVDQIIAERIRSRVLGLAYRIDGYQLGEGIISHLGPNRGFTPIQNPADAFMRVFGEGDGGTAAAADRVRRRRSVLDSVARDLGSLTNQLPAADRPRLAEHLEFVRNLEGELLAPAGTCSPIGAVGSYDARDSANLPRLMRDYTRIMVEAMRCGYTRVGFLQAGNLGGAHKPRWPELGITSDYADHAIAHRFNGAGGAGGDGLSQRDAIQLGVRLQQAYNTMFANVLTALNETEDVDGSPMLDHTIVIHIKQMGRNHGMQRLLWIGAGGGALGVRTGRFLRVAAGRCYHDLHVTLCHKMGVTDVTQIGEARFNDEPLDLG